MTHLTVRLAARVALCLVALAALSPFPAFAGRTVLCESTPHCGCKVKVVTKPTGTCGHLNPELHVEITVSCPDDGATCVETFDVCGTDNQKLDVMCAGKSFSVGPNPGTSDTWGGIHAGGRCKALGVSCG